MIYQSSKTETSKTLLRLNHFKLRHFLSKCLFSAECITMLHHLLNTAIIEAMFRMGSFLRCRRSGTDLSSLQVCVLSSAESGAPSGGGVTDMHT